MKVPPAIRPAFAAAVQKRCADNDWPAGVTVLAAGKKKLLHLQRYPLPPSPQEALASRIVEALQARRQRGDGEYPASLDEVIDEAHALLPPTAGNRQSKGRTGKGAPLLKKTLSLPSFQAKVLVGLKNVANSPAALADDKAVLADSPTLLELLLVRTRTASNEVATVAELKKKVAAGLQREFEEALRRRIAGRTLPAGIGCLLQKNKPLLFLIGNVTSLHGARGMPAARAGEPPAPRGVSTASHVVEFAGAFDAAFARLDREKAAHNLVSLVDLRVAVAVDRAAFDAGLRALRLAGRYTLSAAEGRHGIRPEEREAGIIEDGTLLLFVSRKLT
jgi:hypothetical protein